MTPHHALWTFVNHPLTAGLGKGGSRAAWLHRENLQESHVCEEMNRLHGCLCRTHDRCSRVLDKKGGGCSAGCACVAYALQVLRPPLCFSSPRPFSQVRTATVQAEAPAMLSYLQKRGATGLRVLVPPAQSSESAWLLSPQPSARGATCR